MTNWLITGGCGFIGTQLVSNLAKNTEIKICVVDNLSVGSRDALMGACGGSVQNLDKDPFSSQMTCSLIEADILDSEVALEVCREADVIVHLAANLQPDVRSHLPLYILPRRLRYREYRPQSGSKSSGC